MFGQLLIIISSFVGVLFTELIWPLIPATIYVFVVVIILAICSIIAGVGGSLLFYILIFFYVKALLSYNPILEARRQAVEAAQMENSNGNNNIE
jgi:hypothetical protein